MRILLIRTDFRGLPVPPPYMPIGLLYVASALERSGFGVSVVDLNRNGQSNLWAEVDKADVIGISMLSYARSQAYQIIADIRQRYGDGKKIVLGGPFASSLPELLAQTLPVNAVVVGEGEAAFASLCAAWLQGMNGFHNIVWGELIDMNTLPRPAWQHSAFDAWDMQIAKSRPDWMANGVRIGDARWAPIIASRGCHGRCVFCNTYEHWGRQVRFRRGGDIANEMEELVTDYGVNLFSFDDDAFPYDREQCMEFCHEIKKRNLHVAWKADTRADVFDAEMLRAMKDAGCFMLAIGIESGSPTILRNIGKGLDLDKARQAIADMKEVGIIAYVLLMVGNPGETEETIKETVHFLEETKPNIYSFVTGVMVLPGTRLQKMAGVPDEYYLEGDGVPMYLKEHSMEELHGYGNMIRQVPMDY